MLIRLITSSADIDQGVLGEEVGSSTITATESDPEALTAAGPVGFTILPSTGPAPVPDPIIIEDTTNLFLNPTGGLDANDGLSAVNAKQTWAGIKAVDLSTITGIYMLAGEKTTGEQFWKGSFSSFRGTSLTDLAILSSYYLDVGIPKDGLGGFARPIVEGTAQRIYDYDGGNLMDPTQMVPPATATQQGFNGMIGDQGAKRADEDGFIFVKNFHVRHAGGAGINFRDLRGIFLENNYSELVLGAGILLHRIQQGHCINNFISGSGGGEEFIAGHTQHPVNLSVKECNDYIVDNNIVWNSWGEMIGLWGGTKRCRVQDNACVDGSKIKYYIDSTRNTVYRRNIVIQSGLPDIGGNYSALRNADGFSIQGGEAFQFPPQGNLDPLTDKTGDSAIYANVMVNARYPFVFWDSDAAQNGNPPMNLGGFYIFRNTIIDATQEMNEFGNVSWTADDGRIWDNRFLQFEGAQHNVDAQVPRGTWTTENNSWNIPLNQPPWTNNIDDDWLADTTGWDTLYTLINNVTVDNHIPIEDIQDFIDAVVAKMSSPLGNAVNSGHTNNAHPSTVTIASFEDVDYNGNEYNTNDLGAIRSELPA